jgi:copper transport protein
MSRRRRIGVALSLCALLTLPAALTTLHTALDHAVPEKDAHLTSVPTELRLTYTTAVDPRLARVDLLRADSTPLALDSLRTGDAPATIIAGILEPPDNGTFTVSWVVIGSDGHPVRGRYAFVVAVPEEVVPPPAIAPAVDPEPQAPPEPSADASGTNEVGGSAYVTIRWLTLPTILVIVGAAAFRVLVLNTLRGQAKLTVGGALDEAASKAARLGRGAAVFLLLAIPVRALLQARALGAGDDTAALMRVMVLETTWGWGLMLQAAAALAAIIAFARAVRHPDSGWTLASLAALALAFTPALSGHAAAVEPLTGVAVASDGVHVLAASAWLGTLLVLMVAGVPAALGGGGGNGMVADMVSVFSPLAMGFAGVAAGTGALSALLHLDAFSQLWSTEYGRTLLIKIGAVLIVLGMGAYNWSKVRPRLALTGPGTLRRTTGVELLGAAVVLLVTALLIATPTP